jgi:hypothetical protein
MVQIYKVSSGPEFIRSNPSISDGLDFHRPNAAGSRPLHSESDAWAGAVVMVRWESTLFLTYGPWEIPTEATFVLDARYLYPEKETLIEALEKWLAELHEEKCELPFCFCQ